VLTDLITKRVDPLPVTLTSFVTVAVASAALQVVVVGDPDQISNVSLFGMLKDPGFLIPAVLSTIFATVLAITLMNVFQRELDPVRAAIIYAIEPVWAAAIAIAYGLASVDKWLWIGGGALLAGNLVAELVRPAQPKPEELRGATGA
jgi:drug/metabolite transporter (DMT)-like permease